MKEINIWTDGACSGNPGKGGWCAILQFGQAEKIVSGGKQLTTNNEMELSAVINGLKTLKEPCNVNLYSDSAYVVNAFLDNWISKWENNGWCNSKKQEISNKELWIELISLTKIHNVNFIKVKGHADNKMNNKCDQVARGEIIKI